jgi:hypothetical protein
MWGDPRTFAESLGIDLCSVEHLPFLVGSTDDFVVYRWDERAEVRAERAWTGLAQCILTRAGIRWGEGEALAIAKRIFGRDHDAAYLRFIA